MKGVQCYEVFGGIALKIFKVCLVGDCNGLSKLLFISPMRQTNHGIEKVRHLFSKHRVSKIVSSVWWRAEQIEKM